MSSVADNRANNTANTACATMNGVSPRSRASSSTRSTTVAGTSNRSVADVLRDSGGHDAEDRNEAQQFIFDFLIDRTPPEANAGEVMKAARAAGFGDQSIKDARRRSKNPRILSVKSDFGAGWVWQVDPQGGTEGGERGRNQDSATIATFVPPSEPQNEAQPPDTGHPQLGEICSVCGEPLQELYVSMHRTTHPGCYAA